MQLVRMLPMSAEGREWKQRGETALAVAIICAGFVMETMTVSRGHPDHRAVPILVVLGVCAVTALGRWGWCRRQTRRFD
jgi:hypothetical protein